MHGLASRITDYFISMHWSSMEDRQWCIYALETRLLSLSFFLVLLVVSTILYVLPQATLFSTTLYALRRRWGGWHAMHAWQCQILSLLIVIGATTFVGPFLLFCNNKVIIALDILVMFLAFCQKPVYPAQAHFDSDISKANNHRKNMVLLLVVLAQLITFQATIFVVIYTFLAVLTGLVSVYIELLSNYLQGRRVQRCVSQKNSARN